jgi:hypothetical protein
MRQPLLQALGIASAGCLATAWAARLRSSWPWTVRSWPTTLCPGSIIPEVRRMIPQ